MTCATRMQAWPHWADLIIIGKLLGHPSQALGCVMPILPTIR